jgi:membrane protein DedA with SNARE-associated domain
MGRDNLSYLIGWRFGPWATRRFFAPGTKDAARREWVERSLSRFGMGLIIVCQFIPGGRTAVTLCCGLIRYDWRRFAVATAVAAVIWASYAFLAGCIGGRALRTSRWWSSPCPSAEPS